MKKVLSMLFLLLLASASFAQAQQVVTWRNMQGVITSVNVDNPVGNISAGTFPWTVDHGRAAVNLSTGDTTFTLDGLVINGSIFSGTPGPITRVVGTLVCNAGDRQQAVRNTRSVALNPQGDAHFSGRIENIPSNCGNPIFLIRIAVPTGAAGRWIATGAERFTF